MAMKVAKVDVWAATIEDRPGGLAKKLQILADAGANLGFVIARRAPDKPGTGVVFLTPLKGAKQAGAARKAGCRKTKSLHSLRIDAPDKRGLGAKMTAAIAAAGINLRGLSAAVIGRKSVIYLAFDKGTEAAKAARILRRM
jgi:hypothetical protein